VRRLVGVASHACWAAVLWAGEAGVALAYRHLARSLGGIAHDLLGQAEVARLAHPFYNTLLRGGEGHQEVGKNIHYSDRRRSHLVLSLKPFGCMPSQLSDGVQSAVVERHPGSVFQAVETSGEGEIHAQSRVQMALSEAKARMKTELEAAVRLTGRTLEEVRAYTAAHPDLRRAGYRAPNGHGVAGRAAAFVWHVSGLMDGRWRAT
jgi:hypothetical protein